jgi:methylenetetrahydrofolate reductase (NADPH)
MGLFSFPSRTPPVTGLADMLANASIEVTPRTAAKVGDFRAILPAGTRVYIAHIAGTDTADMVATTARLRAEGMEPVAHLPARVITGRAAFADLIMRYRDAADLREALVLGGGATTPEGPFLQARDLMDTGHLDQFRRLDIAGHPEGNRDIDPDGGMAIAMQALHDKQDFARATGCHMGIVTQFAFEAPPLFDWIAQLRAEGITLPVHLGLAGPAKLQTLLKYAIACGVGPSLAVLQKRARDMTKLLVPFEPTVLAAAIAAHNGARPDLMVAGLHLFPLGGIAACTDWMAAQSGLTEKQAQGAQA